MSMPEPRARITCSFLCACLLALSACSSNPGSHAEGGSSPDGASFANNAELNRVNSAEEYRIGASDLLEIKVFQADELSGEVRVDGQGNISLPLLGEIPVAGLTQAELKRKLEGLLGKNILQNPQVAVFIKEYSSQRVTVEGEVKKPGVYPINGEATVLQAIAQAEGLSNLAADNKVVLFRRSGNQVKAYNLDFGAIRDGQVKDPYVRNDDRIVVHRSTARYWLRETATLLNPFSTLNTLAR